MSFEQKQYWLSGREYERERILTLLEEHIGYGDKEWDESVTAIAALIKGETE